MLAIFFIILYLVPVLPVARRLAYVLQTPSKIQYRIEERTIKRPASTNYVYINTELVDVDQVCNNCGGDVDFHEGGRFRRIHDYGGIMSRRSCNNYEKWDGKTTHWDEQLITTPPIAASIPLSIAFSVFWPAIVSYAAIAAGYKKIDPDWNQFAKPYHVESRTEKAIRIGKEQEQRNKQLQARIEELELENSKPLEI